MAVYDVLQSGSARLACARLEWREPRLTLGDVDTRADPAWDSPGARGGPGSGACRLGCVSRFLHRAARLLQRPGLYGGDGLTRVDGAFGVLEIIDVRRGLAQRANLASQRLRAASQLPGRLDHGARALCAAAHQTASNRNDTEKPLPYWKLGAVEDPASGHRFNDPERLTSDRDEIDSDLRDLDVGLDQPACPNFEVVDGVPPEVDHAGVAPPCRRMCLSPQYELHRFLEGGRFCGQTRSLRCVDGGDQ